MFSLHQWIGSLQGVHSLMRMMTVSQPLSESGIHRFMTQCSVGPSTQDTLQLVCVLNEREAESLLLPHVVAFNPDYVMRPYSLMSSPDLLLHSELCGFKGYSDLLCKKEQINSEPVFKVRV
ncbi:hypothetical protein XENORESO_003803 [Xenotaenia resolanae]|uniref:Uncharacterized protein n=1 Tax=Xenotaenia resolanae TaxID=208358 RepID=A0ABV0VUN2_9TELE